MPKRPSIPKILESHRKRLGLLKSSFAELIGVSLRRYSYWTSPTNPKPPHATVLVGVLSILEKQPTPENK